MSEIGLFPLGLVLLPTEQVPLHIFEPRYQELIGESLEQGNPFGIVYADDDGLRQVGTLATISDVTERFEDGRSNVIVVGGERFRLLELTSGRSFVTASVEPFADQDDPAEDADIDRALELFGRLAELTESDVVAPDRGTPELSFSIAGRFEFSAELKQELLAESSERVRLVRLCELLAIAAETVERQREVALRAQTNGKVHPPS
ncbi:LON peptidase substrate-binding domain-containing protein [Gaiella sp.]|uniref:LON peptidase substrate-binding domain-containing protein n=1 Tax=Gaiella sp. TaxID=2663207 RepID=UPI0032638285